MLVFGDSRIFFVCTNAKKVTETGQNPYSLVTQRRKKAEIKTFLIKKTLRSIFLKFLPSMLLTNILLSDFFQKSRIFFARPVYTLNDAYFRFQEVKIYQMGYFT